VKQRRPQLRLEGAQRLGERRLGDLEPLGSPRHAALFGDGEQVAKLALVPLVSVLSAHGYAIGDHTDV